VRLERRRPFAFIALTACPAASRSTFLEHVRVGLQAESDVDMSDAVADHLRTHAGLRCPVLRTEPCARAGHVAFTKEVSPSEALVEDDSACVVDAIGCAN
jgi:hypothetical protein